MPENGSTREMQPVRYDDSLRAFVRVLADHLTSDQITSGWIVRSAAGKLSYIAPKPLAEAIRTALGASLVARLGPYVGGDHAAVLSIEDAGVSTIIERSDVFKDAVRTNGERPIAVQVLDRRIVGQDW